jgi:hypothetical protein
MRNIERIANKKGLKILGPKDLPAIDIDQYSACHIIGSGWSLEKSIELAQEENAYRIGFNFACLSGLKFDTYFVEFGGYLCEDITIRQIKALDHYLDVKNTSIYFKNLHEKRNNIEYANEKYGQRVRFIRDILVPCLDKKYLHDAVNLIFKKDDHYLRQAISTAITCIVYARLLGFKKIVLHGIDFRGKYFFDLPEFSSSHEFRPPTSNKIAYSKHKREKGIHYTNIRNINLKQILPFIQQKLLDEGVTLYSATSDSPSSEILPVYHHMNNQDKPFN